MIQLTMVTSKDEEFVYRPFLVKAPFVALVEQHEHNVERAIIAEGNVNVLKVSKVVLINNAKAAVKESLEDIEQMIEPGNAVSASEMVDQGLVRVG